MDISWSSKRFRGPAEVNEVRRRMDATKRGLRRFILMMGGL